MTRSLRRGLPVGLALLAVAASGCGVDSDPESIRGDQIAANAREVQERRQTQNVQNNRRALPRRDANSVALSVPTTDSASAVAARNLERRRSARFSLAFAPLVAPFTPDAIGSVTGGSTATIQEVRAVKLQILKWKSAHSYPVRVILDLGSGLTCLWDIGKLCTENITRAPFTPGGYQV